MKKFILALFGILTLGLVCVPAVAFADSQDITYTVDSNSSVPFYFCDESLTNSQVKCSDYSHIIFSPSSVSEFYFTIAVNTSTIRIPNFTNTTFDLSGINAVFIATLNNQSFSSVTVTLTNSLECPEPVPPEPCPDCGDASRFIQIVIDAFWQYHVYFAGAVVSIISIFLVYRLLRGRLR